jgi:hypothetical protein
MFPSSEIALDAESAVLFIYRGIVASHDFDKFVGEFEWRLFEFDGFGKEVTKVNVDNVATCV